jgi:hypothetical protein
MTPEAGRFLTVPYLLDVSQAPLILAPNLGCVFPRNLAAGRRGRGPWKLRNRGKVYGLIARYEDTASSVFAAGGGEGKSPLSGEFLWPS